MPVYVTEYERMGEDRFGTAVAAPVEPAVANQQRTASGTSAQTAAFNEKTRVVMVHTTEVVCYAFGLDPTAAATAHRVAAGETRFYTVTPGHKLAVITGT